MGYGTNKGIVPLACEEIFRRIKENTDPNVSFEVLASKQILTHFFIR